MKRKPRRKRLGYRKRNATKQELHGQFKRRHDRNKQQAVFAIPGGIEYTEKARAGAKAEWARAHFFVGEEMEQIGRIREIADRVAVSEGLELVEVEFVGRGRNAVLRIFLDKPGGITVRDCEQVSRQVGAILDVEDFLPGNYTLEVSSPGLDRRLVKPTDYERFAGKPIKLVLKTPLEGRRRFQGLLRGIQDGRIQLQEENGETIGIEYGEVEKANLVVEWQNGTRRPPPKRTKRGER